MLDTLYSLHILIAVDGNHVYYFADIWQNIRQLWAQAISIWGCLCPCVWFDDGLVGERILPDLSGAVNLQRPWRGGVVFCWNGTRGLVVSEEPSIGFWCCGFGVVAERLFSPVCDSIHLLGETDEDRIIVTRLIPRIGFPWTMRICAFMFLGLLLLAMIFLEPRVQPQPKPWKIRDFMLPLKEPPFVTTALGLCLFSWGMFIPFNFLVLEAQTHGMSLYLANYLIAILNAVR